MAIVLNVIKVCGIYRYIIDAEGKIKINEAKGDCMDFSIKKHSLVML